MHTNCDDVPEDTCLSDSERRQAQKELNKAAVAVQATYSHLRCKAIEQGLSKRALVPNWASTDYEAYKQDGVLLPKKDVPVITSFPVHAGA